MKYVFSMLEVTFSLWFTCNCRKMSPWIQEEFSLFLRKSSKIGHACAKYSWDGSLLSPFQWRVFLCTPSHWLIYSRKKNSKTFTIFFHVLPTRTRLCFITISSWCCNCLLAITILLIFLDLYTIVHILRIQQTYLSDIRWNFPFGHTRSAVWFHLTRPESQAAMMVGVP
jgi:hypothetical protein